MLDYEIHGSKGGSEKAHTPVETPNNLLSVAYAKVLIAVAEGELAGVPTDQDIFLDGTPLANPDGSKNFGGVKWEWRPGTTDQTYIAGLPEVSTEYNVGVELKTNAPYVRSVTKSQLDAVRITFQWPALLQQMQNGDTVGVSMDYSIEISTAGGPFVEYQRYNINGKTNTAYERTHRVELPKSNSGWIIRAKRLTAESTSGTIQDTINVKSITEVVDVKQRYPNTALLYVEFDSRMFGAGTIPKISVRTKGRIIRVPSNYNPLTRSYSGIWDGSWKWAWSDNPAWVFQDILTQDRFGTGNKVDLNMIDKWALYEISQYCDVMVDDGHNQGVMIPRHTCNIYIQEKQDAWKVLRDIANIFNGMTYWNGTQFVAVADKQEPLSNIPVFSRSNVVDGSFNYTAADDKSIYTSALVSYDEPSNHYNSDVESTFDNEQILRWGGDRQIEISAIGCTSRGEAQRRGKYALITNQFNRTVTFRTGLQGLNDEVMPGKLIHVVDPLIGGRPFTGRIVVAVGTVLTLDRDIDGKAGDVMYMTKADGSSEGRTIQAVSKNIVTLTTAYSELPKPNAVWYLEAADLKSQLFRVTKISSPQESIYEIEGVEYNDSKYNAIDNGARLEPRPVSVVPPNIQQPPTNVKVTSFAYVEQEMAVNTMVISWDQTDNAVGYEVQWKVSNGDWINAGTTGANEVSIRGIYTGQYVARVRAINALDIKSVWTNSVSTSLQGKTGLPPALTSLTIDPLVFGMRVNWTFPEGAEDTSRTEIMYSPTPSFQNATKLGDYAYPQVSVDLNGLKAGQQFYFWGRLVDKTGNIGPYYPATTANGVQGTSSTDFDEYEEYLKDMITESALGQQLEKRIDLIDGPPDVTGSVNNRISETKKELQDNIDETNQNVTEVKNNLQQQIDNISDLADSMPYNKDETYALSQAVLGDDGKLYQAKKAVPVNTPPPNTEFWTDIGQAVVTADGLAARVTTVETAVDKNGKDITAQSTRIDGVVSQLDGKASTTALNSLSTKVTDIDGKVTTQGQSITGLQSNLTTTNQNVTKAQQAADAANSLAGGKGKVLVQSTTPVAADQLAQNLWIDTTNGANTPKRWTGSAWVAVTDKVATDAAQAAANALNQVATKAEASAVNALTTRVSSVEGSVTTQGQSITSLTNSLTFVGGENLAYNPDFNKIGTDSAVADGYLTDGPASPGSSTGVFSLVTSFMNSGEKAQRIVSTGLNQSALYRSIRNNTLRLPKVSENQPICSSIYVRGTSGMGFRIFIQQINSSGNVLTTTNTVMINLDGTIQRVSVNIPSPASGTVSLVMFYRFYGGLTVFDGSIEMARPQIEYGSTPTGWKNNTQVNTSDISATSTAVSSLTSTVTQQGDKITSNGNNIVSLNQSISAIQGSLGATGLDPANNGLWNFDSSVEGWVSTNSTLTTPAAGILRQTATANDPWIKIDGININGALYSKVRVSITRRGGNVSTDWDGRVFYATASHGFAGEYYKSIANPNLAVGSSTVLEFDMAALTAGGNDWVTSTITSLRIDIGLFSDSVFDFDWIAIGRIAPAASSSAVQSLSSTVSQQGTTLTSQGSRVTSLENSVNNTTDGLATKASASALTSVSNRVTAAEGTLKTQSDAITSLNNNLDKIGSDNLLLNSSFEQVDSSGSPTYWRAGSTATPTPTITFVDSPLSASVKAVRLTKTGVAVNGFIDLNSSLTFVDKPKVVAGQPYTLSVYARASSSAMRFASYVQFMNSSDAVISTIQVAEVSIGTEFTRLQISGVAPAGSVKATIFAGRLINRSTSTADIWLELDNAQFEQGPIASGYAPSGSANANAINSLSTSVTQQGTTITSQGNALTSLQNTVTGIDGRVTGQATAINNVDTRVTQVDNRVTATANRVDGIYVQVNPELAGDDTILAGTESGVVGVWSEQSARIEDGVAMGQRVDNVQASIGNVNAAVQQTSTAIASLDGRASAAWSVKLQVNQYGQYVTAGVGLGLENGPGGLQSTFIVNADTFAVTNNTNSNLTIPFFVQGGQTFIKSAVIQDASISFLKIGDDIQSTNYVSGQSGWRLSKGGVMELNGSGANGRMQLTGGQLLMWDTAGKLRIRMSVN